MKVSVARNVQSGKESGVHQQLLSLSSWVEIAFAEKDIHQTLTEISVKQRGRKYVVL